MVLFSVLMWLLALLLAYAVIRLAVTHALRSHSVWTATGGLERARRRADARAERDRQALARYRADARRREAASDTPDAPA